MAWIGAIIGAVVGGIGASGEKTAASRARRKQRKLMAENMAFYQGIWNDYKTKYGGIEDKLVAEAEKGLDYKRFADTAQADVAGAYDRYLIQQLFILHVCLGQLVFLVFKVAADFVQLGGSAFHLRFNFLSLGSESIQFFSHLMHLLRAALDLGYQVLRIFDVQTSKFGFDFF